MNTSSCFSEDDYYYYFENIKKIFDLKTLFKRKIFYDFRLFSYFLNEKYFRTNPLFIKDVIENTYENWDILEMKELFLMKTQINDVIFKFIVIIKLFIGLFLLFGVIAILIRYSISFSPFFIFYSCIFFY